MKTIILATVLALAPLAAKAATFTVDVNGLVCAFCATAIEKTLTDIDGVNTVNVNLDSRVVTITAEDGKEPTDAVITKAIEDAGYNVVKINR